MLYHVTHVWITVIYMVAKNINFSRLQMILARIINIEH